MKNCAWVKYRFKGRAVSLVNPLCLQSKQQKYETSNGSTFKQYKFANLSAHYHLLLPMEPPMNCDKKVPTRSTLCSSPLPFPTVKIVGLLNLLNRLIKWILKGVCSFLASIGHLFFFQECALCYHGGRRDLHKDNGICCGQTRNLYRSLINLKPCLHSLAKEVN